MRRRGARTAGDRPVIHLLEPTGRGPVWGTETADLNATLLVWPAGHTVARHVNRERDVLLIVLDGSAVVTVDGRECSLATGDALIIPKDAARQITAGPAGARYLTVHHRRGPLQITTRGV